MTDENQVEEEEEEKEVGEESKDDANENDERLEQLETQMKELKESLQEKEEELQKEKEKEKNFGTFRAKEKGKRGKLSEQIDELKGQIEKERDSRQEMQESMFAETRETALNQLAGSDKDLKQKLTERVKESEAYLGTPKTSAEIIERYEKAYGYLKGEQRKVNKLNAFHPVTGQQEDPTRKKNFTETAEGKALFESKFPQIAELEKKNKK